MAARPLAVSLICLLQAGLSLQQNSSVNPSLKRACSLPSPCSANALQNYPLGKIVASSPLFISSYVSPLETIDSQCFTFFRTKASPGTYYGAKTTTNILGINETQISIISDVPGYHGTYKEEYLNAPGDEQFYLLAVIACGGAANYGIVIEQDCGTVRSTEDNRAVYSTTQKLSPDCVNRTLEAIKTQNGGLKGVISRDQLITNRYKVTCVSRLGDEPAINADRLNDPNIKTISVPRNY